LKKILVIKKGTGDMDKSLDEKIIKFKPIVGEIIDFFDKIKCPAKFILKNNLKGEGNFYDYYIINSGKDITSYKKKYSKLSEFEKLNKISLCAFYSGNCISIENLILEFEEDLFNVVYKSDKEEIYFD
jgi:hypothetical protein